MASVLLPPFYSMLHCLQTANNFADRHCNTCMGELPSEVRVQIFCLALELPIAGALLLDWLNLALVSQCLLGSPSLCCENKTKVSYSCSH